MQQTAVACLLIPALFLFAVATAEAEVEPPTFSAPFCGVHAIYTALRIEGIDVDFRSLLRRDVVSSESGSTFEDLQEAARVRGASTQVMENLSFADLIRIHQPAILHVRSEYDAPQFDHFVLCVANGDGDLLLYDAPTPPSRITEGKLAALWDGSAMFVSRSPIDLRGATSIPRRTLLIDALAVGMLFGVLALVRSFGFLEFPQLGGSRLALQISIVVGTALGLAACFHAIAQQGLLRQAQIAITLARSQSVDQAPYIDLAESQRRIDRGALVIDARDTSDFAIAHLPGAVNIPPDAPKQFRDEVLRNADRSSQMVVYCAGPECPHASNVANRLIRDGFLNVAVFSGGWQQWSSQRPTETASVQEMP